MTKKDLVKHFGDEAGVARFLNVSRAAISKLPDDLSEAYQDRIIGRMKRLGKRIPKEWLTKPEKAA